MEVVFTSFVRAVIYGKKTFVKRLHWLVVADPKRTDVVCLHSAPLTPLVM